MDILKKLKKSELVGMLKNVMDYCWDKDMSDEDKVFWISEFILMQKEQIEQRLE